MTGNIGNKTHCSFQKEKKKAQIYFFLPTFPLLLFLNKKKDLDFFLLCKPERRNCWCLCECGRGEECRSDSILRPCLKLVKSKSGLNPHREPSLRRERDLQQHSCSVGLQRGARKWGRWVEITGVFGADTSAPFHSKPPRSWNPPKNLLRRFYRHNGVSSKSSIKPPVIWSRHAGRHAPSAWAGDCGQDSQKQKLVWFGSIKKKKEKKERRRKNRAERQTAPVQVWWNSVQSDIITSLLQIQQAVRPPHCQLIVSGHI